MRTRARGGILGEGFLGIDKVKSQKLIIKKTAPIVGDYWCGGTAQTSGVHLFARLSALAPLALLRRALALHGSSGQRTGAFADLGFELLRLTLSGFLRHDILFLC